jgi:hypothetical protein
MVLRGVRRRKIRLWDPPSDVFCWRQTSSLQHYVTFNNPSPFSVRQQVSVILLWDLIHKVVEPQTLSATALCTGTRTSFARSVLVTPDFPKETKCKPICMPGSSCMHIVTYKCIQKQYHVRKIKIIRDLRLILETKAPNIIGSRLGVGYA